jgi:protocatechuate 3,4-dioxygenase beta subunit
MKGLKYLLSVIVLLLGAFAVATAQENATISGQVTDPSGAAVPNATITVTHATTGEERTTQSSASGFYEVSGLAIGSYNLKAVAPGFKTYDKTGRYGPCECLAGANRDQ